MAFTMEEGYTDHPLTAPPQAAAGGIGQHIIACTFCICFVSSELYFGFCYFVSGVTSQVYNKFMHLKAKICIGTAR